MIQIWVRSSLRVSAADQLMSSLVEPFIWGVKWGPGRAVVRGGSELPGAFARGEKQEKEEEETLKSRNSIEHQHCVKSGHNDAARTEGKSLSGRILS